MTSFSSLPFFEDSEPQCVVHIESTWREASNKKKKVKDEGNQTKLAHKHHGKGIQTTEKTSVSVQTIDAAEGTVLKTRDSPALLAFLRRVEPEVCRQLSSGASLRAFDHWMPNWNSDDRNEELIKNFELTFAAAQGMESEVSAVAWNSNGSVIAVAFGSRNHSTWCSDHKGGVATWNVDRVRLRQSDPDQWQETTSCLMTLEWHPGLPAVLAGGNFLGEILIWNWSKKEEPLLGQTEAETSGHREPVTQIRWLPDEKTSMHRRQRLLTSGTDGRIVVWQISLTHPSRLIEPVKAFELKAVDIPKDLKKNVKSIKGGSKMNADPGKRETGVNCMVLCLDDSSHVILGNETGAVFRASMGVGGSDRESDGGSDRTEDKSKREAKLHEWQAALKAGPVSPVVLAFEPSDGPIYCVDFSPFHRNLFLACGADGTVKMYHQFQAAPCLTVTPPESDSSPVLSVRWSPKRPLVFACCLANGLVLLYDLGQSTTVPYTKFRLNPDLASTPASSLAFNPRLPLLAVGAGDGSTQIWGLPVTLTERVPRALQLLGKIAGEEGIEAN